MQVDRIGGSRPAHELDTQSQSDIAPTKNSGSEPFSLGELVDFVNPLQHIPLVNTLYREITGDEASSRSRVAGSMLYGTLAAGPLGAVGLTALNITEMAVTGKLQEDVEQTDRAQSVAELSRKIAVPDPLDSAKALSPAAVSEQLQQSTRAVLPQKVAMNVGEPLSTVSVKTDAIKPPANEPTDHYVSPRKVTQEVNDPLGMAQLDTASLAADPRNVLSPELLNALQSRHLNALRNEST
ncbi:hypothetical protein E1162_06800 [Rhodobacteraceae bacterium RKSG542]|uniref:hypothetical protein n=1 Tax=Pseudovibrio flavus TaxID=2529854 RepID=UPI0012BCB4FE|nr:hypothetical protein [Pseudovibrio flavus]MTI16944.1 hypothetical protein [Pseudovibrio flavus]